jgi:hypothetical protein
VLTASAQQREVTETLKALTLVREELGVHTFWAAATCRSGCRTGR